MRRRIRVLLVYSFTTTNVFSAARNASLPESRKEANASLWLPHKLLLEIEMPAPGPKDGHASKASRDLKLTRGASAKSNGFKYGGVGRDLDRKGGQGGAGGARTGISNSLRDQRSRRALQQKFLERKRKREEEDEEDEEERKDRFTENDDDEKDFDDEKKTKKKRRRLDEESEFCEKREKEEEEKEEADAATSSDPPDVSTKRKSKIVITFPWICDVCFEGEGRKVVAQSEHQRNDHLNSKKHKKNCEKRRGKELLRTMFFAEKKETTLGT